MTVNTNEPTREVVNRKLVIFKQYQVDVKNIKCFFNDGKNVRPMFHIIGFLACQVFRIVGSQIKMKIIFSLAGI